MTTLDNYSKILDATPVLSEAERETALHNVSGRERLFLEALRIMHARYWQLRHAGKLPAGINPDDADEALQEVALKLPALIKQWQPERGMFTTYLYARLGWDILRQTYARFRESERYETGVFDTADDGTGIIIPAEGNADDAGTVADDAGIHSLPVADLMYAEPPLGLMNPYDDYAMSQQLSAWQRFAERKINPRDMAKFLGIKRPTAAQLGALYKRRDRLVALLEADEPSLSEISDILDCTDGLAS